MAHFQFSDYYIGRSTGGSATQTAAQLASDVIVDRRYGERFDYTDRRLPLHRQLVVPARAPTWAALRQELWNGAEAAETRVNAIAADVTIRGPGPHQDPLYHSATLLMTTRRLDERGFHEKAREWQDRTSGTIPHWRARWAELQNEALAAAGIDARVDHRRAAPRRGADAARGRRYSHAPNN